MVPGPGRLRRSGIVVKSAEERAAALPSTAAVQRHTVRTLMAAQIIGGIGVGSAISVGALLAEDLSGSASWSGMSTTTLTLGAALLALPLARMAARRGRRVALSTGWLIALLGALVVIGAAILDVFWLMLAGMVLFGAATATRLQSRFAAADLAEPRNRARSLAVVMWSTTIGSVLGPNLTEPGATVAGLLGIPPLAGPFVFSAAAVIVAAAIMWLRLRPDPLLTARREAGDADPAAVAKTPPLRAGLVAIRSSPGAVLGIAAVALSHAVMVSVMAMTPVHMKGNGATLTIVGLVISVHIAGMYALSPLVGWLADRWGRVPVILTGQGILIFAALTAGTAGDAPVQVTVGLFLIGLGWSFGTVAGSALLAESVALADRPGAQGFSDLLMNLLGALGGGASGVVLSAFGFAGVNMTAALLVIPVVLLALRRVAVRRR